MTAEVLERLFRTIESRKGADPQISYTAKLFLKGTRRIAQKVGEFTQRNEQMLGLADDWC